ncbi:MAG: Gfo/Idh/MocA family oxidoreductase [Actinobacteria bacterium]|nr:Gfo/Idh/MocA family oxidoreductase [Actinomycetota bacterium]
MRALAAGKHVLCEKPYSRHPAEVEDAFGAAAEAGLVLLEAFMYRHHS